VNIWAEKEGIAHVVVVVVVVWVIFIAEKHIQVSLIMPFLIVSLLTCFACLSIII
jgi:hypothetical protein